MPSRDATGKRLSGAAQRRKRDAELEPTPADLREAEAFKRLARKLRGEDDVTAATAYLRFVVERIGADPAPTPAARSRRQAMIAGCQALAKAADPKKLIAELAADLRAAHDELFALKDRDAPQEPPRDPGGPPAAPH